jgi:hypothetical protein
MQPWGQLFGYLAWPITRIVLLFVARYEIRNILKSLEERLRESGTTKFTASPQGITLETQLDAKDLVSNVDIDRIQGMLDKFQHDANKPLQLRIQRTRTFIEAKKSPGE